MIILLYDVDECINFMGNNKFELLLFCLGEVLGIDCCELFGINVFKVCEILVMFIVIVIVNVLVNVFGVVNICGQIIFVIDLFVVVGCVFKCGFIILMVIEFVCIIQVFVVEEVDEIVWLEWNNVLVVEGNGGGLVISIVKFDGDGEKGWLVQVLDVEQILCNVMFMVQEEIMLQLVGVVVNLFKGFIIFVVDDLLVVCMMIE